MTFSRSWHVLKNLRRTCNPMIESLASRYRLISGPCVACSRSHARVFSWWGWSLPGDCQMNTFVGCLESTARLWVSRWPSKGCVFLLSIITSHILMRLSITACHISILLGMLRGLLIWGGRELFNDRHWRLWTHLYLTSGLRLAIFLSLRKTTVLLAELVATGGAGWVIIFSLLHRLL